MKRIKEAFAGICATVDRFWPAVLTIILLVIAIFTWRSLESSNVSSDFATYISGFSSAIALIWLVAGFRIQSRELGLQRQELELQRLAAQQQARELKNSAKLGSLAQIKSLLDDAERCVQNCPLGLSSPVEIQGAYFERMQYWKVIGESQNPSDVIAAYQQWLPSEAVAKNYVRYIAAALRIYIEFHCENASVDATKGDEEFLYTYEVWARNGPFISHHIGVSVLLANYICITQPGLECMRLAYLVASVKSIGKDLMKQGALEKMRDKVLEHGAGLPAICSPWIT